MKIHVQAALLLCTLAIPALAQLEGGADRIQTRGPGPGGVQQATFFVHRLGTDHAEGITTLDMNGDGLPDLLSGAYWYENPGPKGGEWKRHQYRTQGTLNEFATDCGEWTVDVNHDGAPDVVTAGWMQNGVWWYENPKKLGAEWKRHFITNSYDTEGGWMADINGDGKPDLILSHYDHSGILWIDFSGPEPKVHHVGGRAQDGHGIGVADIDGDGKADILTTTGWFRQIDADKDQWEWHPDWHLGDTGFPIIGYDVKNDGKMDLIYGQGHSYGLYWLEQQVMRRGSAAGSSTPSTSPSRSRTRSKWSTWTATASWNCWRASATAATPATTPAPTIRWSSTTTRSTAKPVNSRRYPISVNGTAGAGTQFIAEDLDGDGDIDIATAGKTGVHFFENLKIDRVPKAQREKEILLDKNWPFPDEGPVVTQEEEPK